MIECVKIKRLLSRYVDQEIGNADTAVVEAHLENCPACKKELAEILLAKELISGRERKVLPQDYLVSRLREEITGRQYLRERFSLAGIGNLSRRLIPLPVAVIAFSLVFLILSSRQSISTSSLEEHILSGTQTTTEMAVKLILGVEN